MKFPFPIDPVLTGIAIAYKNPEVSYIADQVLPRLGAPLTRREFSYIKTNVGEGYTVPDTRVGRKARPNEVEFSGTEVEDKVNDYGLDDPIPQDDINNAPQGFDLRNYSVGMLMNLIMLDREVRVAGTVFAAATYPAANKVTLSGTSQWSDYTNSNPLTAITAALDIPTVRPNVIVLGQAVWTKVRSHPKIVAGVLGNDGTSGAVRRQQVAELLEVDEILVGQSFINSAKKGQAATMARVWGKHCAMIHRRTRTFGDEPTPTFGFTAQYGTRVAGSEPDSKIGLRGGERVRAGESVKEVIADNSAAYFFENAIA